MKLTIDKETAVKACADIAYGLAIEAAAFNFSGTLATCACWIGALMATVNALVLLMAEVQSKSKIESSP